MADGTQASGQLIVVGIQAADKNTYLNSDSTTPHAFTADNAAARIVVDSALGIYFELKFYNPDQTTSNNDYNALYIGNLNNGAKSQPVRSTTFSQAFEYFGGGATRTNTDNTTTGDSIAIDTSNHKIYIPVGSVDTNRNGYLVSTYSVATDGTVSITTPTYLETSTGDTPPSYFYGGGAFDGRTGNLYFDNAPNSPPRRERDIQDRDRQRKPGPHLDPRCLGSRPDCRAGHRPPGQSPLLRNHQND